MAFCGPVLVVETNNAGLCRIVKTFRHRTDLVANVPGRISSIISAVALARDFCIRVASVESFTDM